jgi:hypothetical protein
VGVCLVSISVLENVVLAHVEHRRVGQVDEAALVLEQRPACGSAFLGSRRVDEVFEAVPIHFGYPVERRHLTATGRYRRFDARIGERTSLGVAANPQGRGVVTYQWSMVFSPVPVELVRRQRGQTPKAQDDLDRGDTSYLLDTPPPRVPTRRR